MDQASAIAFLEQWAAGKMDPGDQAAFVAWLMLASEPEREELLELAMSSAMDLPERAVDIGLGAKIEAALDGAEVEDEEPTVAEDRVVVGGRRVRRMIRWMAAAVVVGLLVGVWTWIGRNASKPLETGINVSVAHDALPGGNRAVLTLSGGRRVVLDSAGLGEVAEQGGVAVRKTDSGQLAYATGASVADGTVLYNTLATPRGGRYQLVLPDGTLVWLNAASSITYPTAFTGGERVVEMTGEAYFEVHTDAAKPFKVRINGEEIGVLGTAFNVNGYTDEPMMAATLVSGKIRVAAGGRSVILQPGEQAQAVGNGALVVRRGVDIEKITAWKEGRFIFERDSLSVVMRQLARWYDVRVSYKGGVPPGHYSGSISRGRNLSQVLAMLKATENFQFYIQDKTIYIQP